MTVTAAKSKAASAASAMATTAAMTRRRSVARPGSRSGSMVVLRPGHAQAVADAPLGVDQVGAVPGELAAQVGDVGVHDGARSAEIVVPHVVEELSAREHPPGIEQEVTEQAEFGRRELDQVAGAPHLVGVLIECEVRELQ